jgi:DNA-binding transcriptional ArsR family regulator
VEKERNEERESLTGPLSLFLRTLRPSVPTAKEDMPVSKLVEILAVPQAAVSQQLSVLRNNRLVAERREGRNVFYHLRNAQLANLIFHLSYGWRVPLLFPINSEQPFLGTMLN